MPVRETAAARTREKPFEFRPVEGRSSTVHVALNDIITRQELGALDGTVCKACEIVVACARHGGRCSSKSGQ